MKFIFMSAFALLLPAVFAGETLIVTSETGGIFATVTATVSLDGGGMPVIDACKYKITAWTYEKNIAHQQLAERVAAKSAYMNGLTGKKKINFQEMEKVLGPVSSSATTFVSRAVSDLRAVLDKHIEEISHQQRDGAAPAPTTSLKISSMLSMLPGTAKQGKQDVSVSELTPPNTEITEKFVQVMKQALMTEQLSFFRQVVQKRVNAIATVARQGDGTIRTIVATENKLDLIVPYHDV